MDWGLCLFRASFGYCSFLLAVQASVRFPNLSLVVDLWSAASLRSAKGRAAAMVDLVSGWFEIFLLREVRRYNSPEGGVEKGSGAVLVVVVLVACFDMFRFELVRFVLLFHLFSIFEFGIGLLVCRVWTGLGVYSGGSWAEGGRVWSNISSSATFQSLFAVLENWLLLIFQWVFWCIFIFFFV